MSVVLLRCPVCENDFERNKKEYNRSQKFGRPSYCTRSCSGKAHIRNLGEYCGKGRLENLVLRTTDQYTPFRYFLRSIKRREYRKGKSDIDLKYLKALWDTQYGICPFTGWELVLPEGSSVRKNKSTKRASLDRIDNLKGYVKGNVRFIAIIANYCRNNFSDNELKLFCEAVSKNM
jgi:hypothetical protein